MNRPAELPLFRAVYPHCALRQCSWTLFVFSTHMQTRLATRAEFSHVLGVAAFLAHGTQMGAQA